jgi:ankyrin repeat protein
MWACAQDFDMMENVQLALLEQGAEVAAADQNGDTALHYAARNGDKNGAKILCDMLLEFGALTGAVNNAGQTALDIAAAADNEPLVKLLLAKG